MEIQLIKENIKSLLEKGHLSDCIALFKSILSDESSIKGEIILIESGFNRLGKEQRIGTISTDEKNLSNNKTAHAILALIENITVKDVNLYNEWNQTGEELQVKLLIHENKKLKTELESQKSLLSDFKKLKINSIDAEDLATFSIVDYWDSLDKGWQSVFWKHFPNQEGKVRYSDIQRWMFNLRSLTINNSTAVNLYPIKALKELETLELNNCSKLNNIDVIKDLKKITNLNIQSSYIPSLKPVGLQKEIKILKINDVKSQGLDLADILSLEKLTVLEIDQYVTGVIYNLDALSEIKSLKYLKLKWIKLPRNIQRLIEKKVPGISITLGP